MLTMRFYTQRNADGTIHITNGVMGMSGQHHVHTVAGLERWRRPSDELIEVRGECSCAELVDKYPMS